MGLGVRCLRLAGGVVLPVIASLIPCLAGCSSSSAGSGGACTPNPDIIAQHRECMSDDTCPCGAHCDLGVCVASCGAGIGTCSGADTCDAFGRCGPPGPDGRVPVPPANVGSVILDSPRVVLPNLTTPIAVRFQVATADLGPVRIAIDAPFQLQCSGGGTFGPECRDTNDAKGTERVFHVRVAPGTATAPASPGIIRIYWGASFETVTVDLLASSPPPPALQGAYIGSATLTDVAIVGGGASGTSVAAPGSFVVPVTANVFASGGAGVIQLGDRFGAFGADASWVGSMTTNSTGGTLTFPRKAFGGAQVTADFQTSFTLSSASATPFSYSSAKGRGVLAARLTTTLDGAFEGGAHEVAHWQLMMTRTGGLPSGASAPGVSGDAPLPATGVAATPSSVLTALLATFSPWGSGRTTPEYDELLDTGGDVPPSISPARRLDACEPGVVIPDAYWSTKSATTWTPTRNFLGPNVPVGSALLSGYTTGAGSLFGVVLAPLDPTWSINSFQLPTLTTANPSITASGGMPCAVDFGTQQADSCIPSNSPQVYGVVDRCAELAASTGCTPIAGTGTVTFQASLSVNDASGVACNASVTLNGNVKKLCAFTAPSTGQCAEILGCTSGLGSNNTPDPTSVTGDLGYAFSSKLTLPSVSGDLRCAQGVMGIAIPSDATRDQGTMQATSAVIAACVKDRGLLATATPTTAAQNGVGLDTVLYGNPPATPACIDARRMLAELEWASDADRARALGDKTRAADDRGARLEHRLLQQWLQIHTLIATEAGQRLAVPDAVRGTVMGDNVPAPLDALADSLAGWGLLLHPRFGTPLVSIAGAIVDQPDYRPRFVANIPYDANYAQPQGLPLEMIDTLRAQLDLLLPLLENAALTSDNTILDGTSAPVGSTLRAALAVLPIAEELHLRAKAAATARGAAAPAWEVPYSAAEASLRASLGTVLAKANDFASGHNPLGIEDSDLPLYFFGNSTDPTARFSAISDYFLGGGMSPGSGMSGSGWAVGVLNAATTAAAAVGTAYQTEAQRLYEQSLSTADIAKRLDDVRLQYGNDVSSYCGAPGTLATKDILEHWGDQAGRPFSGTNCYMQLENPACRVNSGNLSSQLSRDDVLYQLCVAQQVNRQTAGSLTFPDPGLTQLADPSQDLTTCGQLGPCSMSPTSQCMQCGIITATVTASILTQGTALTTADPSLIDAARQTCRASYPDAREQPPSSSNVPTDPFGTGACYRGSLGEAAMTVRASAIDVQIARADFAAHQQSYDIAMQSCLIRQQGNQQLADLQAEHDKTMQALRAGKLAADVVAEAAGATKDCFDAFKDVVGDATGIAAGQCASAVAESAAKATADGLEYQMQQAEDEHNALAMKIQDDTDWQQCTNDASMQLVGAQGDALRIQRAIADQQLAAYRLNQGIIAAQTAFDDGTSTLAAAVGRTVHPPDLDPWVNQTVQSFQGAMHRARRFVYLAERAVEYEYQASMSARSSVLAAQTPADLQSVVSGLLNYTASNRLNGNSPSNLEAVLSLRQHLLQIQDRSHAPAGEQTLSDIQRFRMLLQDRRYAVFDDSGVYQGQQIPFSLAPLGALKIGDAQGIPVIAGEDCAERIWSTNASVLGDPQSLVHGDQSTFTRMDLLKNNTFYSQWCGAPAPGQAAFQHASVRPSVNLFADPEFGVSMIGASSVGDLGASSETQQFSTARMQPRLNVSRADFESTMYENGQTSELAARGLYGEYILSIPAEVLSIRRPDGTYSDGLNLDAVDDILLRFDYVSVAR